MSRRLRFVLVFAALLGVGLAVRPVGAQIPSPSVTLSVFPGPTFDGAGIAVTFSVTSIALTSDGFILLRRASTDFGSQVIAELGNIDRGYTDYTVPNAGIWCYQLVAAAGGRATRSSHEVCTAFVPGVPGTMMPVFSAGCRQFFETLPVGTAMSQVAAHFTPKLSVASIWRYDPLIAASAGGFFADHTAPVDFSTLPATDEVEYVCVTSAATFVT